MSPTLSGAPPRALETIIVGGSLGGLTTALALSHRGIASTVLERTVGRTQRGVAILVSGAELHATLGPDAYDRIGRELGRTTITQGVFPHAWWDVYSALRAAAVADDAVTLVEGAGVTEVGESADEVWARTGDGARWNGDVLVGADGYRSVVRGHVTGDNRGPDYAGYVVWLGQSPLPADYAGSVEVNFFDSGPDMLAVYPLADAGDRPTRFGWGWFDPGHNSLLREVGAVARGEVLRTPRVTDIPDRVYDLFAEQAARKWDEPWRQGVVAAFRDRDVVATPISEYLPDQVVAGRTALVGDAAHAQTPMTGRGFQEAVADAKALAEELAAGGTPDRALERYEFARLSGMRRSVSGGQGFSRAFGRH